MPRIGSEVLIDFLDGDLDSPVIVGSLYNSEDAPPFAAGVGYAVPGCTSAPSPTPAPPSVAGRSPGNQSTGLISNPANHPGVLSGWHQPTVEGGGYNQWLLDDATGQLRTRLLCSQGHSALSLGTLIEHRSSSAAGGSQRGGYRGEGIELASQDWGAASDVATGIALAASAAAAQLQGAAQLADALAQAASQQGATAGATQAAFKTLAIQLEAHTANTPRLTCEAHQPCPKAGYRHTAAKADSRRLFQQGEIMPSLGGD